MSLRDLLNLRDFNTQRNEPRGKAEPKPDKPAKGLKRTRLRSVSKETGKLNRHLKKQKDRDKERAGECMKCRQKLGREILQQHEIGSGHARESCLFVDLLKLFLCADCHPDVQYWPIAKQIALSLLWHLEYACADYSEVRRGRATRTVEPGEVIEEMKEITKC